MRSAYVAMLSLLLVTACEQAPVEAPATAAGVSEAPVQAAGEIRVYCGTLIDGLADAPLASRTVSMADGRITAVTNGRPAAGEFVDLGEYTCLPGFIDTHAHVVEGDSATGDLSVYFRRTPEEQQVLATRFAADTLNAGFTAVRNLGNYDGWADRTLRERIERGDIPGPRMQVAGYYLTIPGGGGDLLIPGHDEAEIPARLRMGVARGADQFRAKAEALVDGGADVLKVIASGAVLAYGGVPGEPEMTPEELEAVAEVAHAAGIRMTAHAHGAQSIKDAILAGADSIEHASLADDEAIALAAERDVAFSMDIYNANHIETVGRESGWPEEFLRKNDETAEAQRQVFTKAHTAGVPITFGTDSGVYPHGDAAKQFPVMVERGMTPMESIQAATSVAAKYTGWDADVGAIETGRYGDLIAVRGDPLADIGLLQHVEVVIKGGERVR